MLPNTGDGLQDFKIRVQPSKTYKLDIEKGIIRGYTDGKTAIQQAVYKILNTERFINLIYSWNYGSELNGIMGRSKEYVYSELRTRIKEALLMDDRISDVHSFEFSSKRSIVSVTFTVVSTEGSFESGVNVNV